MCMKTAILAEHDGLRTFVLVCETGDEAMQALASFAAERRLGGSHFTAIGAFSRAIVAYFDWPSKQYRQIAIDEQVEVLSLVGDVTVEKGKPKVHAHVVLGKADATPHGGHLIEGLVILGAAVAVIFMASLLPVGSWFFNRRTARRFFAVAIWLVTLFVLPVIYAYSGEPGARR